MEDVLNRKSKGFVWLDYFTEHKNIEKLTREVVVSLIREIKVFDKTHIEVVFDFDDCYKECLTVKDVVEALQSTEGGDIPTDIYGESLSGKKFETLTVRPKKKKEEQQTPGQMTLFDVFSGDNTGEQQFAGATEPAGDLTPAAQPQVTGGEAKQAETAEQSQTQSSTDTTAPAQSAPITPQPSDTEARSENDAAGSQQMAQTETSEEEDLFDREEVMKFINDAGLLSYNVNDEVEYLGSRSY